MYFPLFISVKDFNMQDSDKSNEKLIDEVYRLRQRNAALEATAASLRAEVHKSNERFRELAENIYDGLLLFEDETLVYANERAVQILGYTREELENIKPAAVIVPEDRDELEAVREKVKAGNLLRREMFCWINQKSGSRRYVRTCTSSVNKSDGKRVTYLLCSDLTEQKQFELQLKEVEQRLYGTIDNIFDGFIMTVDGDVIYINDRVCEILGYTREELIKKKPLDFTDAEQYEHMQKKWLENKDKESFRTQFDCWVVRKDGTRRYVRNNFYSRPIESGQQIVYAVLSDITVEKEALKKLEKSEERLRLALEGTNDGVWDYYPQTGEVHLSPGWFTMLGYRVDEFPHAYETWEALLHPEDKHRATNVVQQFIKNRGDRYSSEYRMRARDGSWKYILARGSALGLDTDGNIARMVGTNTDISKRKEAEELLRESEERFRAMAETTPDAVVVTDQDMKVHYWNEGARKIFGYGKEELLGKSAYILVTKKKFTDNKAFLKKVLDSKEHQIAKKPIETYSVRKDGSEFPVEYSASAWEKEGKVFFCSIVRDSSERKRAEELLRKSEERFRVMADNVPVSMTIIENNKPVYVNNSACELSGYSKEELLKLNPFDIIVPEEKEKVLQLQKKFKERGTSPEEMDFTIRRKDGTQRIVRNYHAVSYKGDKIFARYVFGIDLTRQKTAEKALRESEERFRTLAETSSDAIITANSEGAILFWNETAEQIFGYGAPEVLGKPVYLIRPKHHQNSDKQGFKNFLQTGKSKIVGRTNIEFAAVKKDGTEFPAEGSLSSYVIENNVFFTTSIRDISSRIEKEKKITHALQEKEILLKEIHHRVKNNLQIVSSLLRLQKFQIDDDQMLLRFADSENRIQSIALIHDTLYRSQNLATIDFGGYVKQLIKQIRSSMIGGTSAVTIKIAIENIALSLEHAVPCGLIVTELATNALKHAFPDGRKGEMLISMHQNNGADVVLTVSDDGVGMPEQIDCNSTDTLGLRLVRILTENQLKGRITHNAHNGSAFVITFSLPGGGLMLPALLKN